MSERKMIEDKLRRKENEILSLEEKIKAAKVYVQALRDVLKALDKSADGDSIPALKEGSAVAQARDTIMNNNSPMHIDEILETLGKENTRESKASLTSSLAAYVRRNEIFTRPAPNTFGLVDMDTELDQNGRNDGPPPNFGKLSPPPPPSNDDDEDIPF